LLLNPEFILMLTYNDSTVKDALNIFRECKDAPALHWGFKDVGLPPHEMKVLVHEVKAAGKRLISRSLVCLMRMDCGERRLPWQLALIF
jgi:hypothetical protein